MSHPTASWTITVPSSETTVNTSGIYDAGVDLQLDSDGDLDIGTDLSFTKGIQAVKQGAQLRLQMFKSEWFLNTDLGVDFLGKILGQTYNEIVVNSEFRREIKRTPGLGDLTQLTSVFSSSIRLLQVTWKASTGLEGAEITDKIDFEV